ncbi:hypothetical protein AMAG_07822 [Allomyces macrogynus ATCC 38327]|uniref:Transmembrane protein n=1 Tax=Allomyces macrogynus (strain ATCC 38327) TaxID=578462 RepID=A0A0L0SJF7_ALLM3|nr:hypothetical protein AMAG_07822 [Allomyces macrogynus ATCC 38327]|eukprot:KNE62622.1 hypothetical protein AMAG_07822 [Allomyces macrogynus ATCC 38327]
MSTTNTTVPSGNPNTTFTGGPTPDPTSNKDVAMSAMGIILVLFITGCLIIFWQGCRGGDQSGFTRWAMRAYGVPERPRSHVPGVPGVASQTGDTAGGAGAETESGPQSPPPMAAVSANDVLTHDQRRELTWRDASTAGHVVLSVERPRSGESAALFPDNVPLPRYEPWAAQPAARRISEESSVVTSDVTGSTTAIVSPTTSGPIVRPSSAQLPPPVRPPSPPRPESAPSPPASDFADASATAATLGSHTTLPPSRRSSTASLNPRPAAAAQADPETRA